MGTSLRRIIGTALSGVVVAGLTSVVTAPFAAASGYDLDPVSWSYVDSAAPSKSYVDPPNTDMPVGARVFADGTQHINKSYATFDLTGVTGSPVESAHVTAYTTALGNCSTVGATQAWLTSTKAAPTWRNQPTEQLQLPAPQVSGDCANAVLSWDASAALTKALADGRQKLTIELRLPDGLLGDASNWRSYNPRLGLDASLNSRPQKPSRPEVGFTPCGADTIYTWWNPPELSASIYDPDSASTTATFEWWPTGHSGQKQTQTLDDARLDVNVPEGVEYTWRVRGNDPGGPGPWSDNCSFVMDKTKPSAAPVITSADYPNETTGPGHGGTGIPGSFTFTSGGVPDIAGYAYRVGTAQPVYVDPERLGGPATVTIVPTQAGPTSITVTGLDRAGNASPTARYDIWVTDTGPTVSCTPPSDFIGHPRECTATPHLAGTTGYVYVLDNDDEVAVPANADGTGSFTVRPLGGEDTTSHLVVRSTTDSGKRSDPTGVDLPTNPGIPTIDVPSEPVPMGVPVSITMHAVLPDSQTFTYVADYGDPVTVPVGAGGATTVQVVPRQSGYFDFTAYSTDSTGVKSWNEDVYFRVSTNAPTVSSDAFPHTGTGAVLGTSGTFVFSSPVPGAASFTYRFEPDYDPVTVPAGLDGTASVELTPTRSGGGDLWVTTTFADGTVSEQTDYTYNVRSNAPELACTPFEPVEGSDFTCTFTAVQVSAQSVVYKWGDGAEQTVPLGADGTATVTLTMPADAGNGVEIDWWTVDDQGVRSDGLRTWIFPAPAANARDTRAE